MAMKECVACAEKIQTNARLCRYCGTSQDDPKYAKDEAHNVVHNNSRAQKKAKLEKLGVARYCELCGKPLEVNASRGRCEECRTNKDFVPNDIQFVSSINSGVEKINFWPRVALGLRSTWILQVVLFLVGFSASFRNGQQSAFGVGAIIDGLSTMWTDSLVLALVGSAVRLFFQKRLSESGTWIGRVTRSLYIWTLVSLVASIVVLIVAWSL